MEEKFFKLTILEDNLIRKYLKLTLLIISTSILLIVIKFKDLPLEVPLFYSLSWGEKQLANKFFLFLLPLSSILVLLINLLLIKTNKEIKLANHLLISGACLYSFLAIIALIKIIALIS